MCYDASSRRHDRVIMNSGQEADQGRNCEKTAMKRNAKTSATQKTSIASAKLTLARIFSSTEVQGLSFVCSTSEVCSPYLLWNIQNLGALPPYSTARSFALTLN